MFSGFKKYFLSCNQRVVNELDDVQALLTVTKGFCEQKENERTYYGASKNETIKLSAERNYYIRILEMLSEKITNITDLNLCMEQELLLYKNSDYCSR